LARAGKCWSGQEVALLGEQILRRLQAMHTQERSLGLVHSDIKPGNVLYDSKRNIFVLIDFDCATAIPRCVSKILLLFFSLRLKLKSSSKSIAPKKKGSIKKIQGSYLFTGIDVLNGDYPSPKVPSSKSFCTVSQICFFCQLG
jgi:serine/threonine protein kinase